MSRYDQLSLMQSSVLEIPWEYNVALLGGRGGGKSTAALFRNLNYMKTYGGAGQCLVVRKTLKSLNDFEDETLSLVYAATNGMYSYNRQDKILRVGEAKLQFAALDDQTSYERLVGSNVGHLTVEEVTQHRSERILRKLRSNLRAPEGVPTAVMYVGNPGGPLHARVFSRHIKDRLPYVPYDLPLGDDTDDVETWVTVPSTASDNPFIDLDQYNRRLRESCHGDPVLLRQWMFGAWEEGSGSMFPAWDPAVHLVEPPPGFTVGKDAFKFMTATDWGLSSPSVALLGCIAKRAMTVRDGVMCPKGSVWVIDAVDDAIYDNPEDLTRSKEHSPGRLSERIINKCLDYGVRAVNGVVDSARGLRGETLIDEMIAEGGFWSLTKPQKGRRAEGYVTINSMLTASAERDQNRPHLYISPRAKYLVATLPNQVRDEDDPDEIAETTAAPDHATDSLRYLLASARPMLKSGSGRHFGMY